MLPGSHICELEYEVDPHFSVSGTVLGTVSELPPQFAEGGEAGSYVDNWAKAADPPTHHMMVRRLGRVNRSLS
jgi:hypothetical protein